MDLNKMASIINTEKDEKEFNKAIAKAVEDLKAKVGLLRVDMRESIKGVKKPPKDKMIRKTENK